jgi:hypothetical protein
MNTYSNKKITESDIINLESWLMYAHKNFNEETLTLKQQELLSKMINLIKPNKHKKK